MYLKLSQTQLHELKAYLSTMPHRNIDAEKPYRVALQVRRHSTSTPRMSLHTLLDQVNYSSSGVPRTNTPLNSVNLFLDYVKTMELIKDKLNEEFNILQPSQVSARIMMELEKIGISLNASPGNENNPKTTLEDLANIIVDTERYNQGHHARLIIDKLKNNGVGFHHRQTINNHNPLSLGVDGPFVTKFTKNISEALLRKSLPLMDGVTVNNLSISGKAGCDAVIHGVRNDNNEINDFKIVAYQFKDPSSNDYCFVEGKDAKNSQVNDFHKKRIENALNRNRDPAEQKVSFKNSM
jgi:hypothetical protein